MKQPKSSSRLLFYMGYGLVLTLVLLYIRFPTTSFKSYCENRVERVLLNTTCTIEKIRYSFPFSIEFTQLKLHRITGEKHATVAIDNIGIGPALRFWNTFKIYGNLYTGTMSSTLKLSRDDNSYKLTDIVLNDLNLSEILKDQGITNREVSGKFEGSGTYQAKFASPTKGTGKARIVLSKGSFELLQPVLSLSSINFDQINFDVSLAKLLELERGKLKGENIDANFEGRINVQNSFQDSRLQLAGLLEPKKEFLQAHPTEAKMVKQYAKRLKKNGLPFKMGGTLSNPTFRFSR